MINFRDLNAQYKALKNEIDTGIANVLESGSFIEGKQVRELESELAKYVGTKHCLTCANGTDALSLVLRAWNIGANDAVFVPNFTFFATAEAVSLEKATVVFVDVEESTFNISPESLENAIKAVIEEGELNPRVIISVDLFGLPSNYKEINKIAKKYNLLVLEDGAQGFGGDINGEKACSFADAATTSFFPAKPLGCYGDGGAIFTNDDNLNELIRSLKFHGKGDHKYNNVRIGVNSRLDTIQAAILLPKLKAFVDYECDDVNKVADRYLAKLNIQAKLPIVPANFTSSWAQFTLILDDNIDRTELQGKLSKSGIPTMIYYPITMHDQKPYKETKKYVDLSVSEMLSKRVLSIPIHPYLSEADQDMVIDELNKTIGIEV